MIAQLGFLTMADERTESYLQSELRPEQQTNQPTFRSNTVTKYWVKQMLHLLQEKTA